MSAAAPRVRPDEPWSAVTGASLVRAAALLLLAGGITAVLAHGLAEPPVALAFGTLIAIGEAVRVAGTGAGRGQAPLGAAAGLAYALLGPLRGLPTEHGVLQVVAVAGSGLALGALARALVRAGVRARRADRERSRDRK
ncbi:hypothetical protein ACQRUO_31905, partial [Kitasatospora sp. LaBMicrA B282]